MGSIKDLFEWIVRKENTGVLEYFILNCWSLWILRNQWIFQNVKQTSEEVLARATRTKTVFNDTPHNPNPSVSQLVRRCCWKSPPVGTLKVNADAAVFPSNSSFWIGIVGRDNNGLILFAVGRIRKEDFLHFWLRQ